jgi:hypothetical protein
MKRFLHLIRYIKLIKKNKLVLEKSRINENPNGIKYDWIYRLYTVLVLPLEDKENIDRYGYFYMDNMVRSHISAINQFLFELGILEYVRVDTENVEQLDRYNVRIVLRFKFLNLRKLIKFLVFFAMFLLVAGITCLFIFL